MAVRALRPLRHREFRLLWAGLAVSLAGDGVWLVAVAWQVIELGGGPAQLSLVTGAFAVGLVVLMLPGGVLADRRSRRRTMLEADAVRALAVVAVGVLSVAGVLELWHLAVAALVVGASEGCFVPAFAAVVPDLVPDDEVLAANGLEGVVRPVAQRAAGPALGGLLVAAAGPGWAFLSGGAAYVVSAACLLAMTPVAATRPAAAPGLRAAVGDLAEGARYVGGERWLWGTLVFTCVAVVAILGPLEVLVPFVVRDQAGAGAAGFGLFLASFGVASAVGALVVSSRPLPRRYVTATLALWGGGALPLALMGELRSLGAICVVGAVVGATNAAGQVVWGTLLQRRVPPGLRGRVAGLDWFVTLGLLPVSMAAAGPLSELVGRDAVFVVAGVAPALLAVVVLVALRLRRDELAHPLG